jgi:diguanylate cyclase (GGDEF)-like protein
MGRDVGFLFFSSQSARAYTGEHVRLLESISGQLSLAIEKSRLYDRLLDTTRQLEEANAKLEQLASIDGLTGVANRRVFDDRLGVEWRRCGRSRQPLSLLMIDIDHFKRFNDLHGHVAGDTCLRAVAEILTSTVARAADLVARYGGEEFCAILPETTHQQAAGFAEDLRRKIAALEIAGLPGLAAVTVSIGVATEIPADRRRPEDLVRRADASLYIAKNEGRNMVHSNPRIDGPDGMFDVDA